MTCYCWKRDGTRRTAAECHCSDAELEYMRPAIKFSPGVQEHVSTRGCVMCAVVFMVLCAIAAYASVALQ